MGTRPIAANVCSPGWETVTVSVRDERLVVSQDGTVIELRLTDSALGRLLELLSAERDRRAK